MDKRKWIQVISAVIYNADIKGFFTGTISKSKLKNICVPGLNCYSCPGAVSSCPLGSLQSSIASGRIPFFVAGLLILIGVLLGRAVCGFLCPFGLIQELLNKITSFRKKNKSHVFSTKLKSVSRKATYLKYVIFAILVMGLPLATYLKKGLGSPYFCAWICPAGTLQAGIPLVMMNQMLKDAIGILFSWKVTLLIAFIIWAIFVYRPFCRYICPLGAIYSFFNRYAIFGIKVDESKCISCNKCVNLCKMDVLKVNDRECIRCGECISVCPTKAIFVQKPTSLLSERVSHEKS